MNIEVQVTVSQRKVMWGQVYNEAQKVISLDVPDTITTAPALGAFVEQVIAAAIEEHKNMIAEAETGE